MLAVLLNIPRTRSDWDLFSFHHRDSHREIREAIQKAGGPNLPDYYLDPINPTRFGDFLENNSQSHIDMNGALQLPSVDLQDVDIRKENQLRAWIWLHYQEHYNAQAKLRI